MSITGGELIARMQEFKHNPSLVARVLFESMDNLAGVVDPTNPFVQLLESSIVNTSSYHIEAELQLRRQYPILAQTYEDLYLHMSDKDYLDRFSKPAESVMTIMVALPTLEREWVWDATANCHRVTIARDTMIEVDGVTFMILYPIHIVRFVTGQVQISYDAAIDSPIQTLKSSIIDYVTRLDDSQVKWLDFKVPVQQLKLTSYSAVYQKSVKFNNRIQLSEQYHYARVFHRNDKTQPWVELRTTHTDQVFDPATPTAVLRVMETVGEPGFLFVSIPTLYESQNAIMKNIRIDVYTTLGSMSLNMDNYPIDRFKMTLTAVDIERDWNEYTKAMTRTSFMALSHDIVVGGTDPISFEALRDRVIFNGVNGRTLPVSPVQIASDTSDLGFDLVRNTDVVTNRLFLAIRKLPEPSNPRLLTSANIGIMTFIASIRQLVANGHTIQNQDRTTLLPTALYRVDNGVMSQVTETEMEDLMMLDTTQLVNRVNSMQYLYTPYYYVLDDTDEEFAVRAYDLDRPKLAQLSFESQNETLQLAVNTAQYSITANQLGYEIVIVTKSGAFYKDVDDALIGLQIGFIPPGESRYAFINAKLLGRNAAGERIFSAQIETDYDIDSSDRLYVTNARMASGIATPIPIALNQPIDLFHYTTSLGNLYQPSADDNDFGRFLAPVGAAVTSRERLQARLGYSLRNLWSRGRDLPDGLEYQTYLTDVPATYSQDVYKIDPDTGATFSIDDNGNVVQTVLHRRGDPILDDQGQTVYAHRAGDLKLDPEGDPIPVSELSNRKEIDMLMVDGRYRFTTDLSFEQYRTEIAAVVTDWVVESLDTLSDKLLEQTRIYYYPKTTLSTVRVYPDGGQLVTIPSEQSFKVDLYVPKAVYDDMAIRQTLIDTTVRYLDDIITNASIVHNDMVDALRRLYGASVVTFKLSGLGGANYQYVRVAEEHNRMCLRKQLVTLEDMTRIIREDVTVNFHNLDSTV